MKQVRELQKVNLEQIAEWLENPVTLAFNKTCQQQLDEVIDDGGLNAYHLNDADKTQETLATLTHQGIWWQAIIDILDGEGLWALEDD